MPASGKDTVTECICAMYPQFIASTDYIALGELSMKYTSYITITYDPPTTDGIEID